MTRRPLSILAFSFLAIQSAAGPYQNRSANIRPIPPAGVDVSSADRAELGDGITALGREIDALSVGLKGDLLSRIPDVQIYHNAARYALIHNEFFNAREISVAKQLLKQGMERAAALKEGRVPWDAQAGLVVRGYTSKIDGSVQPYGLVIPPSYRTDSPHRHRLDVWFHGRGETLSEVNFLDQRQRIPGEFTPPDTIVLHPYGRYCNANRFAGEVDLFEALEDVKKRYRIDENRIAVRGFSMGGAACWQFATHHPTLWAAAAPGAGFSETEGFLNIARNPDDQPTWWERKLWTLYDSTAYAANLSNLPTVAYSGEIDRQKQAADMMASAMKAQGMDLVHIIGPKTAHSYHPESRMEINRRIDPILEAGRNPVPRGIRFTTFTLKYNRCAWISLDGLERHWDRAVVDATLNPPDSVNLSTKNVTGLSIQFESGQSPLVATGGTTVEIDGQRLKTPGQLSDRSWNVQLRKAGRRWSVAGGQSSETLRKLPCLQGPIDDAFMDSFLIVKPSGKPMSGKVLEWVDSEMSRAIIQWRRQFRGEARVKADFEVTDEDIAAHNLILWGVPSSNKLIGRIADKLPIRWLAGKVHLGSTNYPWDDHIPVMIYPNPLNPKKYVVLNSGFTFREYDLLSNARQTPKLPDYAIIDLNTPPGPRAPGRVVEAGFFDEEWRLQPNGGFHKSSFLRVAPR